MTEDPGPGPAEFVVYGRRSAAVVVVYVVAALLLLYFTKAYTLDAASPLTSYLLVAIVAAFLVRYLLTQYRMDDATLFAWRPVGSRRVRLETVRRIEYANLRDLGPVGMFGSWGYRGRMWSPVIGSFDAIYTDPKGLLVTAGEYPLFISPKDPDGFARELSRRVRSYTGRLEVDVGDTGTAPAAVAPA